MSLRRGTVSFVLSFVLFSAGLAAAQTPGPPTNLTATVNADNTIRLNWSPPVTGGVPTGYLIEYGSTQVTSNNTTHLTPPLTPATYMFRVRALNGAGVSASADITVTMACPTPATAENLSWRQERTRPRFLLFWTKSADTDPTTLFTIHIGSSPGASDILVRPQTGNTSLYSFSFDTPPGIYYVRITGTRACGGTSTSAERTVVVRAAEPSSQVLINELGILSSSISAHTDFVELKNVGASAVDVSGWRILAGTRVIYMAARIPDGTMIPSGCTLLMTRPGFSPEGDVRSTADNSRSAAVVDAEFMVRDSIAIQEPGGPAGNYPFAEGSNIFGQHSGSYARINDTDTNNNQADFVWLATPTPQGLAACGTAPPSPPGPSVPSAPTDFSAQVAGPQVTLSWRTPTTGAPLTHYVLEAGSAPGLANLGSFLLQPEWTSVTFGVVADGIYYVRLRAVNSVGASAPSNEVTLVVCWQNCTLAPGPVTNLTFQVSGQNVLLQWRTPTSGGSPTEYVIEAGTGPGLTNIAQVPTGSASTFVIVTSVPPGTYYVRVRARNGGGMGAVSNEVVITVQ